MPEKKYTVQAVDDDQILGQGLSLEDAVKLMIQTWAGEDGRRGIYVGYVGIYNSTDRDDWVAHLPAMDECGQ